MQSPMSERQQAERHERIARILNAARKLLLRKGYAGTTMRDICTSAQLSTRAVYFYFSGKEENKRYSLSTEEELVITRKPST